MSEPHDERTSATKPTPCARATPAAPPPIRATACRSPAALLALQERAAGDASRLFARRGLRDLAALRAARGRLRRRRQPARAAAPRLSPEHLAGIELLPERHAAARGAPARGVTLRLRRRDAACRCAPASVDIVLQSTVFSSLLDDAFQQRLARAMWRWRSSPAAACSGTTSPSTTRATATCAACRSRACARCFPQARHRAPPRHAGAAARARASAASTRRSTLSATPCRCCAPTCSRWLAKARLTDAGPQLPFLPFALPEIGDDEIAEVVDTLRSGWVTTGPKAKRFEDDFSAFLGDPALHSLAVNSATAGLHLALEALRHRPGRRGHHHHAHLHRHRRGGALPRRRREAGRHRPGDAEHRPDAVEARDHAAHQGDHAGALRRPAPPTCRRSWRSPAGTACRWSRTRRTRCRPPAAASWSARSTRDATVFSFYANKTITTGEGGMVVTRDADAGAARCRRCACTA